LIVNESGPAVFPGYGDEWPRSREKRRAGSSGAGRCGAQGLV
jgi:hypothetical protein